MELTRNISAICPVCHFGFAIPYADCFYEVPLIGKRFSVKCPKCGQPIYNFAYRDEENSVLICVERDASAKTAEDLSPLYQAFGNYYETTRIVKSVRALKEKIRMLNDGFDDALFELYKIFLQDCLPDEHPELEWTDIRYHKDGACCVYNKNEVVFIQEFDTNLYYDIYHNIQYNLDNFAMVDQDWASDLVSEYVLSLNETLAENISASATEFSRIGNASDKSGGYIVGERYSEFVGYPDGAMIDADKNGLHLTVFLSCITKDEAENYNDGRLTVKVTKINNAVWFLFRFGDNKNWDEAPFSLHLSQIDTPMQIAKYIDKLYFLIFDTKDGKLEAARVYHWGNEFVSIVSTFMLETFGMPFDKASYHQMRHNVQKQYTQQQIADMCLFEFRTKAGQYEGLKPIGQISMFDDTEFLPEHGNVTPTQKTPEPLSKNPANASVSNHSATTSMPNSNNVSELNSRKVSLPKEQPPIDQKLQFQPYKKNKKPVSSRATLLYSILGIILALILMMSIAGYAIYTNVKHPSLKKNANITENSSLYTPQEITVYITPTGKKYHRASCQYVQNSGKAITLEKAKKSYDPCSICKPAQ